MAIRDNIDIRRAQKAAGNNGASRQIPRLIPDSEVAFQVPPSLVQPPRVDPVGPVFQLQAPVAGPAPAPIQAKGKTLTQYQATAPGSAERKALVDSLFSEGAIQGQRSYWYGDVQDPQDLADFDRATAGGRLDLEEIRAALKAISGQARFREGQLGAERGAVQRALALFQEQSGRARDEAITGTKSEASGRGLLRSGLTLQATGKISEEFAKAQAQARAEADNRLRGIQANLANIKAVEKDQRAERARQLAREQVGTQEAIARALQLV